MWVERDGGELDRIMVGLQILMCVSLASKVTPLWNILQKIPGYGEHQRRMLVHDAIAKFTLASGEILARTNGII